MLPGGAGGTAEHTHRVEIQLWIEHFLRELAIQSEHAIGPKET